MDKPITLSIEDFKTQVVNLINSSNLHPFIIDSIMKELYNEVHVIYQNQVIKDKEQYELSLKKDEENKTE